MSIGDNIAKAAFAKSTSNESNITYLQSEREYENYGFIFERFQNYLEWTGDANSIVEADTTYYKEGTSGVKLTPTAPAGVCKMEKTISFSAQSTKVQNIAIDLYLHNPPSEYGTFFIYLTYNNYSGYAYINPNMSSTTMVQGWNRFNVRSSGWSFSSGYSFNTTMTSIKFRFVGATGKTPSITFARMLVAYEGITDIAFNFDAGYLSGYQNGILKLIDNKIKGTVYLYPEMLNTDGYITTEQLTNLYNSGWDVGIYPIGWVNDKTTTAVCEAEISRVRNFYIGLGFTRGLKHLAYPSGAYNVYTDEAMINKGILTGRVGDGITVNPFYNPYRITRYSLSSTISIATAKGYVDSAITNGSIVIFLIHTLTASPTGNDWSISDFNTLVDYIVSLKLRTNTISELYNRYKV